MDGIDFAELGEGFGIYAHNLKLCFAAGNRRAEVSVRFDGYQPVRKTADEIDEKAGRENNATRLQNIRLYSRIDADSGVVGGKRQDISVRFKENTFQCRDRAFGRGRTGDVVDSCLKILFLASDFQKKHLIRKKDR